MDTGNDEFSIQWSTISFKHNTHTQRIQMTSSSYFRRSKKIVERMLELENEVKEFHNYSTEIINICSSLVQKIMDVGDVEVFLEEYCKIYCYLSSCAASFSEFNCKMETLRLGGDLTPAFLKITFPTKNESDKPNMMEEYESGHIEAEKSPLFSPLNIAPTVNGNDQENTSTVFSVPESKEEVHANEWVNEKLGSGVKKEDLNFGGISEEIDEYAPFEKPDCSSSQTNEMSRNCSGNGDMPVESTQKNNKSGISPKLRQSRTSGLSLNDACAVPEGLRDDSVGQCLHHCENVKSEINQERRKKEKTVEQLRELKIDVDVGVLYEVIISHLVSPDEFYVFVKCEDLMLLDELKKKLNEMAVELEQSKCLYKNPSMEHERMKKLAEETLGSYALGFSKDLSRWTRIKIIDWRMEEDDDMVRVFYVDNGASGLLSLRKTAPMHETLVNYPNFIQKCYLSSIRPIGEEWSEEDKIMFEIFTESAEKRHHMKMERIAKDSDREDGAIGVKLYLPESKICINDKLIEYGIADSIKDAIGVEELCGRYLPPYAVDDTIPVKVTCIKKVNHVFCVKDYEKSDETDVLQSLIVCLNSPEAESTMCPLDKPPMVGDLVIGKYEDDLWYRARVVKSKPDSGLYRVIFLDYGNTETVSMKEMRKMESKYLKIPFQMVECLLEDVELKWDGDPHEAMKYLNEKIAEHTTIKIKKVVDGTRSCYYVRIFDKCGQDIASQLISAGYSRQLP